MELNLRNLSDQLNPLILDDVLPRILFLYANVGSIRQARKRIWKIIQVSKLWYHVAGDIIRVLFKYQLHPQLNKYFPNGNLALPPPEIAFNGMFILLSHLKKLKWLDLCSQSMPCILIKGNNTNWLNLSSVSIKRRFSTVNTYTKVTRFDAMIALKWLQNLQNKRKNGKNRMLCDGLLKATEITKLCFNEGKDLRNRDIALFTHVTDLILPCGGKTNDDLFIKHAFPNLTSLRPLGCLTDRSVMLLTNLMELSLNDRDNLITDESLFMLTNLTSLSLWNHSIRGNPITDESVSLLTNLVSLRISDEIHVTGKSLRKLTKLCDLRLERLSEITDDDLMYLGNHGNLTHLGLLSNTIITDKSVQKLTSLQSLNLRANPMITINSLKQLPKLRRLDLGFNDRINDEELLLLTGLTDLDISDNNTISGRNLEKLPLIKLNIGEGSNFGISKHGTLLSIKTLEVLVVSVNHPIRSRMTPFRLDRW